VRQTHIRLSCRFFAGNSTSPTSFGFSFIPPRSTASACFLNVRSICPCLITTCGSKILEIVFVALLKPRIPFNLPTLAASLTANQSQTHTPPSYRLCALMTCFRICKNEEFATLLEHEELLLRVCDATTRQRTYDVALNQMLLLHHLVLAALIQVGDFALSQQLAHCRRPGHNEASSLAVCCAVYHVFHTALFCAD
jgi:hypothetical protein